MLLVPGYGGSTTALDQLAGRIKADGGHATVVQLPTAPLVVGIVLRTLSTSALTSPHPSDCRSLQTLGGSPSEAVPWTAPVPS